MTQKLETFEILGFDSNFRLSDDGPPMNLALDSPLVHLREQ